jgi:hypothetical protein
MEYIHLKEWFGLLVISLIGAKGKRDEKISVLILYLIQVIKEVKSVADCVVSFFGPGARSIRRGKVGDKSPGFGKVL